MQIHEKIRQARLSANLTEAQLAEKIGIGRSTYQYWEEKTPSIKNIEKVAIALGKPKDYFFVADDENFHVKSEAVIKNETGAKVESKDISALIKSNADIAESNKSLAFSNAKLVNMLEQKVITNSDVHELLDTVHQLQHTLQAAIFADALYKANGDEQRANEIVNEMNRISSDMLRRQEQSDREMHSNVHR